MKQYLISMYQPHGDPPPPEILNPIMSNLMALQQELKDAGRWVFSGALHSPDTATVLRAGDGDVLVTDGPYIEGKEFMGGFTIIQAEDLDEALAWGRKYAEAIALLPIEVRPFQDRPPS
ncbi:MAG TPA: YciI family protein [Streptosporangiaceae bacterium]|nr:YciI family protein [Streptosporangiaceae bacterium]